MFILVSAFLILKGVDCTVMSAYEELLFIKKLILIPQSLLVHYTFIRNSGYKKHMCMIPMSFFGLYCIIFGCCFTGLHPTRHRHGTSISAILLSNNNHHPTVCCSCECVTSWGSTRPSGP